MESSISSTIFPDFLYVASFDTAFFYYVGGSSFESMKETLGFFFIHHD